MTSRAEELKVYLIFLHGGSKNTFLPFDPADEAVRSGLLPVKLLSVIYIRLQPGFNSRHLLIMFSHLNILIYRSTSLTRDLLLKYIFPLSHKPHSTTYKNEITFKIILEINMEKEKSMLKHKTLFQVVSGLETVGVSRSSEVVNQYIVILYEFSEEDPVLIVSIPIYEN